MKKAIVIGASSGIGKGLAELLVAEGYRVGITGRREALLNELKASAPGSYFVRPFDVTQAEEIPAHLEELVKELGGLDLLIYSSGAAELNEALDFATERIAIDTNVLGFSATADWAYNYFARQGEGHIVGISSVACLRGNRMAPAYNASKAFQSNYLEGLRQKAGNKKINITVTDIRPGFVDTPMAKGDGLFWVAPVPKAVKQIYRAIQRRKRRAYITRRWGLMAFIYARIPSFLFDRM